LVGSSPGGVLTALVLAEASLAAGVTGVVAVLAGEASPLPLVSVPAPGAFGSLAVGGDGLFSLSTPRPPFEESDVTASVSVRAAHHNVADKRLHSWYNSAQMRRWPQFAADLSALLTMKSVRQ
jgi:hypothetical protein